MDPIKIEVSIGLSEDLSKILSGLAETLGALTALKMMNEEDRNELRDTLAQVQYEKEKAELEAIKAEAKNEKKEEKAVDAAPEGEDMPDFGAEAEAAPAAPAREVSEDELAAVTRECVKALRSRGQDTKLISTQVFSKFNISKASACPPERRAELVDALKELTDAF